MEALQEEPIYSRLRDLLVSVGDVSLHSEELAQGAAQSDPEVAALLDPMGANLVRPLELSSNTRVLDANPGGGTTARLLLEAGLTVTVVAGFDDQVAALRKRLKGFESQLEIIPRISDAQGSRFDLVLCSDLATPRLDLESILQEENLELIRRLLAPGGLLMLALTNPLGVPYLAGVPDLVTGQMMDGFEGYLRNPDRSTLARREVSSRLEKAGFSGRMSLAFPDHEAPRAVLDPVALANAPELLSTVPRFPTTTIGKAKYEMSSEGDVWRTLVRAGVAEEFGPGLVFLMRETVAEPEIGLVQWPSDLAGVYFRSSVRKEYLSSTRILRSGEGYVFSSSHLLDTPQPSNGIEHRVFDEPYLSGLTLIDAIRRDPELDVGELLRQWVVLVNNACPESGPIPMDLVPHNLMLRPDGTLEAFDCDWYSTLHDRMDVIRRGAFWLAVRLSEAVFDDRWDSMATIGDLALHLGETVDLSGEWIAQMIAAESQFLLLAEPSYGVEDKDRESRYIESMHGFVGLDLHHGPFGERIYERVDRIAEERQVLETAFLDMIVQRDSAEDALEDAVRRVHSLESFLGVIDKNFDPALPPTFRRRLYAKIVRKLASSGFRVEK